MSGHDSAENSEWPRCATDWLILLREDPDDVEIRGRFEAWLKVSQDHQRDWEQISHTMSVLRRIPATAEFPAAHRTKHTPRIFRRLGVPVIALAAAACLAIFAGPDLYTRWQADCLTERQETRTLVLKDGSRIVLAPQSAIVTDFSDGRRYVRLLKGEALFSVKHDPAQPFMVSVQGLTATDVGTVFDIRAGGDGGVTVAVQEGRVSVDGMTPGAHRPVFLGAGQELRVRDGKNIVGPVDPAEIGLWANGQFVAHDWTVADVVSTLNLYSRGLIFIRGQKLASEHVTGLYKLSDPIQALETLAEGQGAHVYRLTPWVIVMSR